MQQNVRVIRNAIWFIFASGVVYSLSYAVHSNLPGTDVWTESLAHFTAPFPFKPRILMAMIIAPFARNGFAESVEFRCFYSFFIWIPSMCLIPWFADRFSINCDGKYILFPCVALVMIAHYSLPNVFAPYFVYDMPALPFYLMVFVLLTSRRVSLIILGAALSLVFFLNRETIIVAYFHAFGWHLSRYNRRQWKCARTDPGVFIPPLTFIASMALRKFLLIKLGPVTQWELIVGPMYEDGIFRLWANIHRLLTEWGSAQNFFAIGFGFVLIMPYVVKHSPKVIKYVLVASIVPAVPLFILGNLLEIRVYTEFVPLMAVFLAASVQKGIFRSSGFVSENGTVSINDASRADL